MPFGKYSDFAACVAANKDKDDPQAYCATIKRQIEGKAKARLTLLARTWKAYRSKAREVGGMTTSDAQGYLDALKRRHGLKAGVAQLPPSQKKFVDGGDETQNPRPSRKAKYWKDIKPSDVVKESGDAFTVNGETVYWLGQEAREALSFLNRRLDKQTKSYASVKAMMPADKLTALRAIIQRHQYAQIEGVTVDVQTANMLVKIYDTLGSENKEKFIRMPIIQMIAVGRRLVDKNKSKSKLAAVWKAMRTKAGRTQADVARVIEELDGFQVVEFNGGSTGILQDGKEVDVLEAPLFARQRLFQTRRSKAEAATRRCPACNGTGKEMSAGGYPTARECVRCQGAGTIHVAQHSKEISHGRLPTERRARHEAMKSYAEIEAAFLKQGDWHTGGVAYHYPWQVLARDKDSFKGREFFIGHNEASGLEYGLIKAVQARKLNGEDWLVAKIRVPETDFTKNLLARIQNGLVRFVSTTHNFIVDPNDPARRVQQLKGKAISTVLEPEVSGARILRCVRNIRGG